MQARTLIVVALPAEARALIDYYRLRRVVQSHAFAVYQNNAEDTWLAVSGIGKVSMAAACAHLHHCSGANANDVWLNIGIAGHAEYSVGDVLLVHSATDANTGRTHYPPILFKTGVASCGIVTVDKVRDDYPTNAAVDMEASAFFTIASRYSTAELVHSIKVISDNEQHPFAAVTREKTQEWIAQVLPKIDELNTRLREIAQQNERIEFAMPDCLSHLRFSFSQTQQCEALLRRWHALSEGSTLPAAEFASARSAKQALTTLQQLIDDRAVTYS
ncbi:MAG: hypothetical protein AAF434_00660 [Pseudomonadota bacterium]